MVIPMNDSAMTAEGTFVYVMSLSREGCKRCN